MLKKYYELTKPGIIYGNILTTVAGFLFASRLHIYGALFAGVIAGTSLVIASACVFNNYIDRGIDKKMGRTKQRALVQGDISGRSALIYATLLGIVGFAVLIAYTNWLVIFIGVLAYIDYIALYGFSKRHSVHGTIVGSFSGAAPVVAGYCVVTGRFDITALLLFLILVLWQMPHFYAIAMYRSNDYAAASIPVLPLKKGLQATKIQINLYIAAFIAALVLLTRFSGAGYTFLIIMSVVGIVWLWLGLQGFVAQDDKRWARKMFFFSLIVILGLSISLPLAAVLP